MHHHHHHHFVLVHGSCHGAWCWYKLAAKLKSAGYRVTALDLGGSGVDPRRFDEVCSLRGYLEPLMKFMSSVSQNERVILVGHSYGGLSVSLAMERFPEKVSVGLFLTAYMPHHEFPPGVLIHEYFNRMQEGFAMDSELTFDQGPENPPTSVMFGPNFLKEKAYRNCLLEDIELARMLVRPSRMFLRDLESKSLLTEDKYGSVKRVFIVCQEDEVMKEEFQRWMIDNYAPDEVKVMSRAGHMDMLTNPDELCLCFQEIAGKYNRILNL